VNARADEPGDTTRDWLADGEHSLIAADSEHYPELLARIADPPAELYVDGDASVLGFPALAIVGSRNPTGGGERNAFEFARHLAGCGFTIVSGLAQGIDTAAHRGALAAGGTTVAVLGHGIDHVYPLANRELALAIAANGALVSEYPLGAAPRRAYFPQRNRIISGLALGTIVVEAARKSGSLITARLAAEQGREVFALPGSIHNPLARGCHRLIRDGAKLVESADDILSELTALARHMLETSDQPEDMSKAEREDDAEYRKLRQAIGYDPVSMDELVERSGLTIEEVSSMLLILELDGSVEKLPGGRYARLS
jgi:DNA processing protein